MAVRRSSSTALVFAAVGLWLLPAAFLSPAGLWRSWASSTASPAPRATSPSSSAPADSGYGPLRRSLGWPLSRLPRAAASSSGEADAVEVSGFAGFVVGLALLPHVVYALVVSFNIAIRGESFSFGPFGLELISCIVAVGLTFWSLGSFVQRGRGLPAGPLGLLGLSEGIAYLSVLGLAIASLASGVRSGSSLPKFSAPSLPSVSLPAVKVPDFKAPNLKVPSFNAPDFKVPDFKAPDFKLPAFKTPAFSVPDVKIPDFKAPDLKVPDFKVPDFKVPEFKAPDIKVPEIKVPEIKAPKAEVKPEVKAEVKAPEVKAAPKAKAPEAKAPKNAFSPDYDTLFD